MKSVDAPNNLLTVVRADGSEQTYDPRRPQGVSVYKEQEKAFSVGDRIQFTAPANELKVANLELGTIQSGHRRWLHGLEDGFRPEREHRPARASAP